MSVQDSQTCHDWHAACVLLPGRRKVEIMHTHSLFTLLGERLMMHTNTVSITTYNTLYEVTSLQKLDFKDLTSR